MSKLPTVACIYACIKDLAHSCFNPEHDAAHGAQVVEVDVVEALQKQDTILKTLGK